MIVNFQWPETRIVTRFYQRQGDRSVKIATVLWEPGADPFRPHAYWKLMATKQVKAIESWLKPGQKLTA